MIDLVYMSLVIQFSVLRYVDDDVDDEDDHDDHGDVDDDDR